MNLQHLDITSFLSDETGIIDQGYNKIDMGIFQGDSFITIRMKIFI